MTDAGERAAHGGCEPGTIYVVATPIGNLEDVTLRALRVLREVDVIAAEDTRHTRVLLAQHGITTRLVAYHDHVEAERAGELVRRALEGERIALVSDAGTPLIADPGYRLLREAAAAGVRVVPVPGPSSPIALLSCAGLPTDRFTFAGFLPARRTARQRALAELAGRPETLVFLESPHRLGDALADMAAVLGARDAVLGRELTKRFEEIRRGSLAELAASFGAEHAGRVRGEVVIAVGGRPEHGAATPADASDLDGLLQDGLARGEPLSEVARAAAEKLGIPRRAAYQRALQLRAGRQRRKPA